MREDKEKLEVKLVRISLEKFFIENFQSLRQKRREKSKEKRYKNWCINVWRSKI